MTDRVQINRDDLLRTGVSPFEKSERLARGLHSTTQGMPARKAPGQNGKSFPSTVREFERNDFMDNRLIHASEVAEELGVSVPYAYKIVRQLNEELQKKGYLTVSGKVSRKYFHERFYGKGED